MSILSVPPLEEEPWPTLGPLVCRWIEENLVFGPGDLHEQPARLDPEKRALIYRFYEVYPKGAKDQNGKSVEGRRRFRRCAVSLQKGSAKTELAAWLAAVELHPEGPVRFDRWDGHGNPTGRGVQSAYIPMVAYTEEQTEDLAYGALKDILEHSRVAFDFDIGLERILRRRDSTSKAVALAGSPNARDGARTTFSHKDETHRWILPALKRAHRTMLANLPKRFMADPWELETTTAYSPGEDSVAEETFGYAREVASGKIKDSRLFFFHRQASDGYDLKKPEGLRAAVVEACGPTAEWKDVDGICDQWQDPGADFQYLERVYLNRPTASASVAFNSDRWDECAKPDYRIPDGGFVVLGFDGSRYHDATGIVATEVSTGHQEVVGVWENPGREGWEVPAIEVDAAMDEAFSRWEVWRAYCDPYWWESYVAAWSGRYGDKIIVDFKTNRPTLMAPAIKAYALAIEQKELSHDGDSTFASHIGNALRKEITMVDDEGKRMWTIQKERSDSPFKIDLAMAGCLSWWARLDALSEGAAPVPPSTFEVYAV